MNVEHSRAMKLGADATGLTESELQTRLRDSLVTLRVDPDLDGGLLCARVLLATLRRNPGRLALVRGRLHDDELDTLVGAVAAIDSRMPLKLVDGPENDSALNIDIGTRAAAGWFRVLPDGFGARLANDAQPDLQQAHQANALGCVVAAAFGAGEAFKYTAGVLDTRCRRHDQLTFCPVTLGPDLAAAAALHSDTPLDIALVGLGAIGTASALILSELKLGGRIIVCDPERFGPENKGTYSLGGEHEASLQPPKTELVAATLTAAGYDVCPVKGTSLELIRRVETAEVAMPRVVLTGLDSPDARRETQGLWADVIIDGQTGDTAAGLCVARPDGPCLRCFFPADLGGPSALRRVAQATGIPVARLADGSSLVQPEDVQHLPPEMRRRLVGKPMCGVADAAGLTDANADGFMPSIPFVSQIAACMVIGRLLSLSGGSPTEANWFQLDALQGPNGEPDVMKPSRDCQCQTRPAVVRAVRDDHYRLREE